MKIFFDQNQQWMNWTPITLSSSTGNTYMYMDISGKIINHLPVSTINFMIDSKLYKYNEEYWNPYSEEFNCVGSSGVISNNCYFSSPFVINSPPKSSRIFLSGLNRDIFWIKQNESLTERMNVFKGKSYTEVSGSSTNMFIGLGPEVDKFIFDVSYLSSYSLVYESVSYRVILNKLLVNAGFTLSTNSNYNFDSIWKSSSGNAFFEDLSGMPSTFGLGENIIKTSVNARMKNRNIQTVILEDTGYWLNPEYQNYGPFVLNADETRSSAYISKFFSEKYKDEYSPKFLGNWICEDYNLSTTTFTYTEKYNTNYNLGLKYESFTLSSSTYKINPNYLKLTWPNINFLFQAHLFKKSTEQNKFSISQENNFFGVIAI